MDLAIVLPTYNERENIPLLMEQLKTALAGLSWEAIFLDDDSPDGTAEVVAGYARANANVRLIQRIHRRGLASACVEGMMATQAPFVAVMDTDLQHDASILPEMLARLRRESLDIVVGTRNGDGGSMGEFGRRRTLLSQMGQRISKAVCGTELSDPMSGYFLLRRSFLLDVVHDLHAGGFKILVELLASARRPVRAGEVGYTFAMRRNGESKLDVAVGIEYMVQITNKLLGGIIPMEMALFLLVGCCGLVTHLAVLFVMTRFLHLHFIAGQLTATLCAMSENFILNNRITFRSRQLRGTRQMAQGLVRFIFACSFGAWANVVFSHALWMAGTEWYLAGMAGIVMGSMWNLSFSSFLTWPMHRHPERRNSGCDALVSGLETQR